MTKISKEDYFEIAKLLKEIETIKLEQDKLAIGFANWCTTNYPTKNVNFQYRWLHSVEPGATSFRTEQLLEMYKETL